MIRVMPRQEMSYLKVAKKLLKEDDYELLLPRKKIQQRKLGKWKSVEIPLFPGYVFLMIEEKMTGEVFRKFKALSGFSHFLKQGNEFSEVRGTDLTILKHFLSHGEVLLPSTVNFDENQRIHVVSGPMVGLEGRIVTVDRRKKRAKILLDFDNKQLTITLGFEVLEEKADDQGKGAP